MEHYKSTLGAAALTVIGLIGAAYVGQNGPFGETSKPQQRVSTIAQSSSNGPGWTDPPARLADAALQPAQLPSMVAMLQSASMALPPEALKALPLASELTAHPETPRKVAATARRKVAQRSARVRQADTAQATPAPASVAERSEAAQPMQQAGKNVDLIGDLLRGLGIGRGREG